MLTTSSAFPDASARQEAAHAVATALVGSSDGLCDGFRAPDEAVVRLRCSAGEAPSLIDHMGGGSSITSAFFLVPVEDAEAMLQSIDGAAQKAMPQGFNPEDLDGALVGAWTHPGSPLVLVGCLASGDWGASLPKTLDEAQALDETHGQSWDRVKGVLFPGNDNGPHNLLESSDDEGVELEASTLDLLYAAITPALAKETLAIWREDYEDVLGEWKGPKRRMSAPKT